MNRKRAFGISKGVLASLGLLVALPNAIIAEEPAAGAQADLKPAKLPELAKYSGGVYDILKLADGKVANPVIVSFIEASPVAFQPTAQEVIMLKDHGVSDDVIKAMLAHGSHLREQRAPAPASVPLMAAQNPAPQAPAPASPAPAYSEYPGYTSTTPYYAYDPSYAYASPTYYPYTYAYSYPYYYPYYSVSLGWYWPWWGYRGYYGGHGWAGSYRPGYGAWHGYGYGYHGGGPVYPHVGVSVHAGGSFRSGGGHVSGGRSHR
jgi:hypothetical protein